MNLVSEELHFLQRVILYYSATPNLVFFDIGANTGEYTEHILKLRNNSLSIHLFEPTGTCFQQLTQKYGDKSWIHLNKWAVSDQNQVVPIYYDQKGSKLASLYRRNLKQYDIEMNESEQVETIRLDQYIQQKGIKKIHLLKVDTEGHELAVLKSLGAYLHPLIIDFIQFEYGGTYQDAGIRLYNMYQLLEPAGFKIAKMHARGLTFLSYGPGLENYAYANYVAISPQIMNNPRFSFIFR